MPMICDIRRVSPKGSSVVAMAAALVLSMTAQAARATPSDDAVGGVVAAAAGQPVVCDSSDPMAMSAAVENGISLYAMDWAPFGAREQGWQTYVPMIQREIGSPCDPASEAFALKLAAFQSRYNLSATGLFDVQTFGVMRGIWQERRPFVMARVAGGDCPPPPSLTELTYLNIDEEHAERITRLVRRDVLDAYRAMVAAARAEVPELASQPELLRIFSSFRDPEADAARCARERNCDGVRRAVCSPHRTGAALDIYVGHLDSYGVDSTNWHNRRYMSETPAYRWMVKNAHRFGFVPYVFEPWHWEYAGGAQAVAVAQAPE